MGTNKISFLANIVKIERCSPQNYRSIILDIKNRTVIYSDDEKSHISLNKSEYETCFDFLKARMKEECGFIPQQTHGKDYYSKLINYTNFPFAPQLNEFSFLFERARKYENVTNAEVYFKNADSFLEELKYDCEGIKTFIKACGIPYSPKNNKLFLSGTENFAEYLGAVKNGFRTEEIIQKVIKADTNRFFASVIFKNCAIGTFYPTETYERPEDEYPPEVNLFILFKPDFVKDIEKLYRFYNEKTNAKLTIQALKKRETENASMAEDTILYMDLLADMNNLDPRVIRKIGKEGWTDYNHDLVMRQFNAVNPYIEEHENEKIRYDSKELLLEMKINGFEFWLPKETDNLIEIGKHMQNCVGHLYIKKAVSKKCIIVTALKNNQYRLCIELSRDTDGRFKMIQCLGPDNRMPVYEEQAAVNLWKSLSGII